MSNLEKAEKYFDGQKNAILSIKGTRWYEEIKRYWQRVWEASVLKISELKSNEITEYKQAQAELKIAQDFISFLDNMENTPDVE